jgi:O-antigen ligase
MEHVALDPIAAMIFLAVFAGVAYATYRHAWWAVCAIVVTAPFALYRDLGPSELTLPKVTIVAAVAGLLASRASWGGWGPAARFLFAGAIAIAAATLLSVAQAEFRGPAIRETLKAAQYALTFAVVIVAVRREAYEIATRITIAVTSTLVSLSALSDLVFGLRSGFWLGGHPVPRLAGVLEGPNQLAGYLGIVLPLQCAFILLRRPIPYERQAFVFSLAVLILTFSRTGILTVLISLAIVLAVSPSARKRTVLLLAGGGALLGAAVTGALSAVYLRDLSAYSHFASLAESESGGGVGLRSALWRAAFTLWREHPLLGIGAGNFELEIPRTGLQGVRTHANSLYVQSLVEGGLPLLAAWVFTLGAAIWTFAKGPLREPLVTGALAATIGLALHQGFDFLTFFPKVGIMFWTMLALGAATIDQSPARA